MYLHSFHVLSFALLCAASDVLGEATSFNNENWRLMLKGEWMVEFFVPWCPACQSLNPVWQKLAGLNSQLNIDGIAQINVLENSGLSGRFFITALPTIFHVKDGVFRLYQGGRELQDFIKFIEDKKFNEIEPISSWKHPDSIQMSIISYFFEISMLLRNAHKIIVDDYHYPAWVSYILFGGCTVLLGGFLGLMIVCCIEYWPLSENVQSTVHSTKKVGKATKPKSDYDVKETDASVGEETDRFSGKIDYSSSEANTPQLRKRRAKKAD